MKESDIMSIKLERLGATFTEEISKIIKEEVKDPDIDFVTITSCNISSDLSYAKVYFTCLNDAKKEEIIKTLNKASGFIRKELCNKVEIRKMPEISFVYDNSIEYGNKIEKIIEEIKKEENNG